MKLQVGRIVRTHNFDDATLIDELRQLWREAPKMRPMYVCRFQYEGDFTKPYRIALGVEHPEGTLNIPDGEYVLYDVNMNKTMGVWNAWQQVWQDECEGIITRHYTVDYEKYEADGTVTLFISGIAHDGQRVRPHPPSNR